MRLTKYKITFLLASLFSGFTSTAQLIMPKVFGNNMVLQRNITIPVWGKAIPGAKVWVELAGNSATANADANGSWKAMLNALPAGGPFELKVSASSGNEVAKETISFRNVLIGDVWVASGQSNMEMKVSESKNAPAEIKKANNPKIRFLIVPHDVSPEPKTDILLAEWKSVDSTTVGDFSAVAYYFSSHLNQEENIPVGIIQSTWGGTPVEAWTSKEPLMSVSSVAKIVTQHENENVNGESFKKNEELIKNYWNLIQNSANALKQNIQAVNYDDSKWSTLQMPATVRNWSDGPYQGIVWFRKVMEIPTLAAGKDLQINLGHPEMNYWLYFNGQLICQNKWNNALSHTYTVPAKFIKKGKNVILLREAFLWGGGGINPPADSLYFSYNGTKTSLTGAWKYKKSLEPDLPPTINYQHYPTYLYNAMINPLIPYGIKGFIWYQGENNTGNAYQYKTLFPLMITDWRVRWQQGYLPFLYVQLANFMQQTPVPVNSEWAELRDAQLNTLNYPQTAMATIIDIGEANDIHPKNKQDVGYRLALAAEEKVYKKNVISQGPVFASQHIQGNTIVLHFSNAQNGLITLNNEPLKGFAIAGSDQKFYWATATVKEDCIEVSSDKVSNPVAVRYGWADNPDCNLYNKNGLPASPFRTDSFEGLTDKRN